MDQPDSKSLKTPTSSTSPVSVEAQRHLTETPISYSECQNLARAVNECSQSLIEGTWVDISHSRGRKKRFIPGNFESAKQFLRASVEGISRSSVSRPETPLTSHPSKSRMAVCHGCHGPIGGGAHQGSAPGKGVCSHPHSILCKGGVVENLSWAACPPNYVYDPNLVLANGSGFDSTLHTFQFQPGGQQFGPNSSTPGTNSGLHEEQVVQQTLPPAPPPLPGQHPVTHAGGGGGQMSGTTEPSTVSRYPGVGGDRRLLEREFPPTTTPQIQTQPQANQSETLTENVQNKINSHRAANQVENLIINRPSGIADITDLRRFPELRSGVETIVNQIRTNIPALSAARSAQACAGSNPVPPYTAALPEASVITSTPMVSTSGSAPESLVTNSVHIQPHVPQPMQGYAIGLRQHLAAQSNLHHGLFSQAGAAQSQQFQQPHTVNFTSQVTPQHGQHGQVPVQNTVHPPQHHLGLHFGQPPQSDSVYQHVTQQPSLPACGQHQQPLQGLQQTLLQSQQPLQQLHQGLPQQFGYQPSLPQGNQGAQQQPQHVASFDLTQHCYEWVTDSVGRQILVRTPLPPTQQSSNRISSFVQQPVVTPQQYRTEFRCCPSTGRQWTVQIPITSPAPNPPPVKPTLEWRIHPHTGERYQVQVPGITTTPQQQISQLGGTPTNVQNQQSYQGNTSAMFQPDGACQPLPSATHQVDQSHSLSLPSHDRVTGIVSLVEGGGGTRKVSKLLELSKKCPTKWSKQSTLATINLPLYTWGVMEEIESALSGRTESIPDPVILGKIRHLKNTLEVCCQNSVATDFAGYGWSLAKDYALKLTDEIEQGKITWEQLPAEVRTSTLMSASMENPRPVPVQRLEPKKPKVDDKKDICLTFNKCTTENKCDYEVANPNRTCQRKHECSWCRLNKNQSWKHQEWKCRNKAGGVVSTAS